MCPDQMQTERLRAAATSPSSPHSPFLLPPGPRGRAQPRPGPPPRASSRQHPQAEPEAPAADHPLWPSPPGRGEPGSLRTAGPPPPEPPVSGLPSAKPGPSQRQRRGPRGHRGWTGHTHTGRPQSAGGREEILVFSSRFRQMLCLLVTLKQIS